MNHLTWKIGGEAGFGIMIAGQTLSKILARAGFSTIEINEYPSLIRGGHNTVAVSYSLEEIHAPYPGVDLLVALNRQTVEYHAHELTGQSAVLYDGERDSVEGITLPEGVSLYSVPFFSLSKNAGGNMLMRNTVALGASCAILGIDFSYLENVLTQEFAKKGDAVVAFNVSAARAGFDYITTKYPERKASGLQSSEAAKRMVLTGADAVSLGAVTAGMKFFAAYPMTPINSILAFMAAVQGKMGLVYKQPEDEIAGINMAIGASFAGVRSMVATSGGGFCLMVEGASFAGMIEVPVVVIMGMRPGPSTGLPTWTGQADLHFVLNAGQGEFPRLVLAPGDAEEAFYLTAEAFNLADRFQTPVFVLVDKYLCETRFSTHMFDAAKVTIDRGKLIGEEDQAMQPDFPRYQLTDDGISPRPVPGRPVGVFRSNSDEHDEHGYSNEEAKNGQNMIEKRMRKQEGADRIVPEPRLYGDVDADITLVGWGSTKGAALEAIKGIRNQESGIRVNYVHLTYINPFPTDAVARILGNAKKIIDIEGNHNGQMAQYIRMKTGIEIKNRILKYDGRPFYPGDIVEGIKKFI